MSKRVLVLVIAAMLIIPATAFGAGLLGLRVGPTAILDLDEDGLPEEFDIADFQFGADARFNFTIVELGLLTRIQMPKEDDDPWNIDALPTAGVSLPLLPMLKVGAGLGPNLNFKIGDSVDGDDDIMNASLSLRGTADLSLGGLSLSVFGLVNSSTTFNQLFDDPDVGFTEFFEDPNYSLGVSLLFTIF